MQETQVLSLGRKDPLEKEMATHSSVLAWRIPGTGEPGGLLSMGCLTQEYWSVLPFPSLGDLPNPGIEPVSPALAGGFFTTGPPGKFLNMLMVVMGVCVCECVFVCVCVCVGVIYTAEVNLHC